MSDYSKYFLMKAEDVPAYIRAKLPDYFGKDAELTSKEIGDGNLNYVFRVRDETSGKTIIVKQAGVELRISKDMHLPTTAPHRGKNPLNSGKTCTGPCAACLPL